MMLRRVLIVDLNYQLNRSARQSSLANLRDSAGRPIGGVFGLLNTMSLCLGRCQGADKVIGVWDGGRSDRRMALFPPNPEAQTGYKVMRGLLPQMTESERAEKQEMAETLNLCRQLVTPILMAAGVHVVQWPAREADDVVAVLARTLAGPHAEQVIVCSDDWDYAQTVSDRICVHRPIVDKWLSLHNFIELVGVPVDWAVVKKSIEGDTSDSIPGVRGVGEVTVAKAVREFVRSVVSDFQDTWYDAHQYRATCPQDLTVFFDFCKAQKSAKVQKISEGRDTVLRNIELVDLSRETFPHEHVDLLLQGVLQNREFEDHKVASFLADLGFQAILSNFAHFSAPFRRIS